MKKSKRQIWLSLAWLLLASLACAIPGRGGDSGATATPDGPPTPTLAARVTTDPAGGEDTTTTTAEDAGSVEPTVDPLATPTLATPGNGGDGSGDGTGDDGTGDNGSGDNGSGDNGSGSGDGSGAGTGDNGNGAGSSTASCPASGANVLLVNGEFEGAFEEFGGIDELKTPRPWKPWFMTGDGIFPPEYKPGDFPGRFISGSTSQQYFKSFGQFVAGVYQQILGAAPGTTYQFSAYGQGWSCDDFSFCGGGVSHNPANMFMRVGIDPYGGTDADSSDIKWSPYFNPIDRWEVACVSATAVFDSITVFTWASPDGPRQNQDVYWEDAKLVALP